MAPAGIASILWILLLLTAIGTGIFGLMFAYHWIRFSANPAVAFVSILVFAIGALFLLSAMLFAVMGLI